MGVLMLVICRLCVLASVQAPEKRSVSTVLCLFAFCCLPWISGVLVWGGIFGLPWVLPMWAVALVVAVCAEKRKKSARDEAGIELPTLRMKRTRVMDDGASSNPNDV